MSPYPGVDLSDVYSLLETGEDAHRCCQETYGSSKLGISQTFTCVEKFVTTSDSSISLIGLRDYPIERRLSHYGIA